MSRGVNVLVERDVESAMHMDRSPGWSDRLDAWAGSQAREAGKIFRRRSGSMMAL